MYRQSENSARDNSRGTATCDNTGRGSAPATPYQLIKKICMKIIV